MKHLIPFDEYAKTYWELEDGTKVTLEHVIKFLDDQEIPVIEIPTEELNPLLIDVKRDTARVEAANTDYPIIVSKYHNNYYSILDGQHRLVKSITHGIAKIKCRVLDLETCPEEFKKVFIR